MHTSKNVIKPRGFTIVELLVVIVVIGILAAITIVSYSGIRNRAVIASMQSDLSNASIQFKMFHIDNGYYPSTISTDCATTPTNTTNLCLKPSTGNSYTTVAYQNPTPQSFVLTEVNGNNTFHITESSAVTAGIYVIPTLAVTDPANWLAVGTQVWAKYSLNVGTMIAGGTAQTNNGGTNIIEKYCYNSQEVNCTTYGGLYQWGEAMKYATAEKSQGICPDGSHIPSDAEWTTLTTYLGAATAGAQLKSTGSSGLNVLFAGYFHPADVAFYSLSSGAFLWSSSMSGSDALDRRLDFEGGVGSVALPKTYGFSIRCVGN